MPVWGFSAPIPGPELWKICVCGTNSATSWWSWGLLPMPPSTLPQRATSARFPLEPFHPHSRHWPFSFHVQDPGSDGCFCKALHG